jgi:hypothetical protein
VFAFNILLASGLPTTSEGAECNAITQSWANKLVATLGYDNFAFGQNVKATTATATVSGCTANLIPQIYPTIPSDLPQFNIQVCGTPQGQQMNFTEMRVVLSAMCATCCPSTSNSDTCMVGGSKTGSGGAILSLSPS